MVVLNQNDFNLSQTFRLLEIINFKYVLYKCVLACMNAVDRLKFNDFTQEPALKIIWKYLKSCIENTKKKK